MEHNSGDVRSGPVWKLRFFGQRAGQASSGGNSVTFMKRLVAEPLLGTIFDDAMR